MNDKLIDLVYNSIVSWFIFRPFLIRNNIKKMALIPVLPAFREDKLEP